MARTRLECTASVTCTLVVLAALSCGLPATAAAAEHGPIAGIFSGSCVRCHGGDDPAARLSLEEDEFRESLVGVESSQEDLALVHPGRPERSYLLMKVEGDDRISGSRMPLAGEPLSDGEVETISEWIRGLGSSSDGKTGDSSEGNGAPDGGSEGHDHGDAAPGDEGSAGSSNGLGDDPRNSEPGGFAGTRLLNLPTTTPIGDHELLFRVSHRFLPPVTSDYDPFWYGLNGPAHVLLSLGYGVTDQISVTLSHSSLFHEYELSATWLPFPAGKGGPLSAGLIVGGGLMSATQEGEDIWTSENMRFSVQAPLSWTPTERFSLLVVPGYATNANHWEEDSEGTMGVGAGARVLLLDRLSLAAEWTTVLEGYEADDDNYGFCLEYEIGGHVFQVLASNGTGLTTGQYLPGAFEELGSSDLRLGFNIFRTFWL